MLILILDLCIHIFIIFKNFLYVKKSIMNIAPAHARNYQGPIRVYLQRVLQYLLMEDQASWRFAPVPLVLKAQIKVILKPFHINLVAQSAICLDRAQLKRIELGDLRPATLLNLLGIEALHTPYHLLRLL